MAALNGLQLQFDARALAAACMSKAGFLYSNLRRMGYETPETLQHIFAYGLEQSLDDSGPRARVHTESGHIIDPTVKN